MHLHYFKASSNDMNLLVDMRIKVLRAANHLNSDIDMSIVEQQSLDYYKQIFETDEHAAYLVMDQERCVGTGGISFYRVMPTYDNPTGLKAYIMNMYTDPEYRRRGIAGNVLNLLIDEAKKRNISFITLEATELGTFLYNKYGFIKMENEMQFARSHFSKENLATYEGNNFQV